MVDKEVWNYSSKTCKTILSTRRWFYLNFFVQNNSNNRHDEIGAVTATTTHHMCHGCHHQRMRVRPARTIPVSWVRTQYFRPPSTGSVTSTQLFQFKILKQMVCRTHSIRTAPTIQTTDVRPSRPAIATAQPGARCNTNAMPPPQSSYHLWSSPDITNNIWL